MGGQVVLQRQQLQTGDDKIFRSYGRVPVGNCYHTFIETPLRQAPFVL